MSIRNVTAAALLCAMVFGASAALAAPQQDGINATFAGQLSEAKEAARTNTFPGIGRSERVVASVHLQYAEALFTQGRTAEAQQYLTFARGKLGLFGRYGAAVAPPPMALQAFTPDFYNPVR